MISVEVREIVDDRHLEAAHCSGAAVAGRPARTDGIDRPFAQRLAPMPQVLALSLGGAASLPVPEAGDTKVQRPSV